MADERGEVLILSAQESGRRIPKTVEVTVLGREPISSGEDPNTHRMVYSNRAWIKAEGLDLNHLRKIIPGGYILEKGLSGGRELLVETHEVWLGGRLVRAVASDPRPLNQRSPRFVTLTTP
ncbi:hypothetical protein HYW44_04050 [Candidatus Daviesbacteria bacterium]|nr:hypothetical protein [Candidatus Daviesbacteria bacterium]